jgi:molybdenum cofactor cytidylyltransferase
MTTGVSPSRALEAVVLAAGAGSRFGGGKLLAPWRDGLLIEAALDAAFAAPARSVTLVVGADPGVMPVALEHAMREGESARLRLVDAVDHAEGMAASLRAGIAALPADAAGAFVFLGDMPRVPPGLPVRLAERLTPPMLAAAPAFAGRRGHPVLFSAALFPALLALRGDEGARELLAGLGDRLATVAVADSGVVFDIDARDDL